MCIRLGLVIAAALAACAPRSGTGSCGPGGLCPPGTPDAQPAADAAPSQDACTKRTFYKDADQDGFGDPTDSISRCEPTGVYTATIASDCCDADKNVFPGQSSYWGDPSACGDHDYDCDHVESMELPVCDACPAGYTGACWSVRDSAPRYPQCGDLWDRRASCSSFLSTTNQWVKCR